MENLIDPIDEKLLWWGLVLKFDSGFFLLLLLREYFNFAFIVLIYLLFLNVILGIHSSN